MTEASISDVTRAIKAVGNLNRKSAVKKIAGILSNPRYQFLFWISKIDRIEGIRREHPEIIPPPLELRTEAKPFNLKDINMHHRWMQVSRNVVESTQATHFEETQLELLKFNKELVPLLKDLFKLLEPFKRFMPIIVHVVKANPDTFTKLSKEQANDLADLFAVLREAKIRETDICISKIKLFNPLIGEEELVDIIEIKEQKKLIDDYNQVCNFFRDLASKLNSDKKTKSARKKE